MAELDLIAKAAGEQKAPKDIHALISAKRRARKVDPPKIWAVRRAVKGTTHLRDRTETRGRKAKMTAEVVRRGLVFCKYMPYKPVQTGIQTGIQTVVKYIQTIQTGEYALK